MKMIKENMFYIIFLLLVFFLSIEVSRISKSIDNLAQEAKRISFAIGGARVFDMEETQRAIRQADLDRQIMEIKRCIKVRFDGETPAQFLERTKDCPQD